MKPGFTHGNGILLVVCHYNRGSMGKMERLQERKRGGRKEERERERERERDHYSFITLKIRQKKLTSCFEVCALSAKVVEKKKTCWGEKCEKERVWEREKEK